MAVVDVNAERAEETAAELGSDAIGIGADVRAPADVRAAVERAVEAFGGLDTLVVSAGVFHMERASTRSPRRTGTARST